MPSESVHPLRISKTPTSSPTKMGGPAQQRPLSEIGPMERRRNSPSFNQVTKKLVGESPSSFDASSRGNNSPHLFWKGRDTLSPRYNIEGDAAEREISSPNRRNSIEKLQKASRVKNSAMFAREQQNEYNPAISPTVERPLAAGRPLSGQTHVNDFAPQVDVEAAELSKEAGARVKGHRRGESMSKIPLMSPSKGAKQGVESPHQIQQSPSKSSLSKSERFSSGSKFDPDTGIWNDDDNNDSMAPTPRPLRRHAKSVTFDAAPPTINEYEMVTPDPSSVASGSRQGSYDSEEADESFDHHYFDCDDSFDASLEDTDKTPVVLPEDWRHMTPDAADTTLANTFEDPFTTDNRGSPAPENNPNAGVRPSPTRTDSRTSDGEPRPLPPVPGVNFPAKTRRESSIGVNAAAERASNSQRNLPSPPQTLSISKSDILNMKNDSLTLEERLRLMEIQNSRDNTPADGFSQGKNEQDNLLSSKPATTEDDGDMSGLDENFPQIRRESILRKVKSRIFDGTDFDHSTPNDSYADLDPDVPIPSREVSSIFDEQVPEVKIKREGSAESEIDVYSIPEMYSVSRSPSRSGSQEERESSVIRHDLVDDDSHYSDEANGGRDGRSTPTPASRSHLLNPQQEDAKSKHKSLPMLSSLSDDDFHMELKTYMNSLTEGGAADTSELMPRLDTVRDFLRGKRTPEPSERSRDGSQGDGPSTPDSIIRHPSRSIEPCLRDSPAISAASATVKAPNNKLATRPSITPATSSVMAETRRQVSGEAPPPIPKRSPKRLSMSVEPEEVAADEDDSIEEKEQEAPAEEPKTQAEKDAFSMKLDLAPASVEDSLDLSLSKEFDSIIEAQKKGYLMRQNTKVVVASTRQFSDERPPTSQSTRASANPGARNGASSPRKASDERNKTWTTEPWNGKARRRSIRKSAGGASLRPPPSVAPPLPGMESNVAPMLDTLAENSFIADDFEEGMERGRLFAKVVGVKGLELPLPKNEQTWFQLTLDNGLHCVTTDWLELGHSAPIGQEFELVVLNELEFQLTLQTKLEQPPEDLDVRPVSPGKAAKQKGALSRFLSPKKRKEAERQAKEEAEQLEAYQREKEAAKRRRIEQDPTAWDLLHDLVGMDGSFARSYVCVKNYENEAFGRPLTVDVPCFNEWAMEDASVNSSVKSKRGGEVRRPPYKVGYLTLQLLYVPKPKDAKDDDMPKSMNACIREMQEAETVRTKTYEGHLSQQGGDCPYWRRRLFRLKGTKLTAYHEATHQPRATINLAKASKLLDDKTQLTRETTSKSGGRRKSAFSEEDGAYMFVEEGFRLRFANGETIDFYADSKEQKDGWMEALSDVVGKDVGNDGKGKKTWIDIVMARERAERAANGGTTAARPQQKETENVPPVPKKNGPPPVNTAAAAPERNGVYTRSAPVSPMKTAQGATRSNAPSPTKQQSPTRPYSPSKLMNSPTKAQQSPSKRTPMVAEKYVPKAQAVKGDKAAKRSQVRSMIF